MAGTLYPCLQRGGDDGLPLLHDQRGGGQGRGAQDRHAPARDTQVTNNLRKVSTSSFLTIRLSVLLTVEIGIKTKIWIWIGIGSILRVAFGFIGIDFGFGFGSEIGIGNRILVWIEIEIGIEI